MKLLRHPAVHWLLALVVGGVFVYASLSKIADPRDFAKIIYHYQVIGPSAFFGFVPANLVAVALPWIELIAGVLLITGVWRREAAVVTAIMLVVFVVAVASTLDPRDRHPELRVLRPRRLRPRRGMEAHRGRPGPARRRAGRRRRPAPARRSRGRGEPGRRDLIA